MVKPALEPRILSSGRRYWRELASREGSLAATGSLVAALWAFAVDSMPSRSRQRFGDADYDWDYRVNTTSGAVGWRDRLIGIFHSPYQPTEPGLFHEMIEALQHQADLQFEDFTFVDLGSGKGRTLLMASDYPFRRILGVELLPALNHIAEQNLAQYKAESQKCFQLESVCGDASTFPLPLGPLVVYLFNPFTEAVLRQALTNLDHSLVVDPRPVYLLYHNPQLERMLTEKPAVRRIGGTPQYSIFKSEA